MYENEKDPNLFGCLTWIVTISFIIAWLIYK